MTTFATDPLDALFESTRPKVAPQPAADLDALFEATRPQVSRTAASKPQTPPGPLDTDNPEWASAYGSSADTGPLATNGGFGGLGTGLRDAAGQIPAEGAVNRVRAFERGAVRLPGTLARAALEVPGGLMQAGETLSKAVLPALAGKAYQVAEDPMGALTGRAAMPPPEVEQMMLEAGQQGPVGQAGQALAGAGRGVGEYFDGAAASPQLQPTNQPTPWSASWISDQVLETAPQIAVQTLAAYLTGGGSVAGRAMAFGASALPMETGSAQASLQQGLLKQGIAKTPDEASVIASLYSLPAGAINTVLEEASGAGIFGKATGEGVKRALLKTGKAIISEGSTEALQEIAPATGEVISGANPNAFAELPGRMKVAGTVGSILGGGVGAVEAMRPEPQTPLEAVLRSYVPPAPQTRPIGAVDAAPAPAKVPDIGAAGGVLDQGNAPGSVPKAEAEPPHVWLADTRKGGHKKMPAVYLRAGNLPAGPSTGFDGGTTEKGVSVYKAWKDPRTGKYVLQSGSGQMLAGQSEVMDRPWYEVSGKDTGFSGSDTEDLLEPGSVQIVGQIDPDQIVSEQDPWLTFRGTELEKADTPDWLEPAPAPKTFRQRKAEAEAVAPQPQAVQTEPPIQPPIQEIPHETVPEVNPQGQPRVPRQPQDAGEVPEQPSPGPAAQDAEEVKGAVGDEVRVMGTGTRLGRKHVDANGVRHELYLALEGDKAFVRSVDEDSGEVVGLREFPTTEAAKAHFDTSIVKKKPPLGDLIIKPIFGGPETVLKVKEEPPKRGQTGAQGNFYGGAKGILSGSIKMGPSNEDLTVTGQAKDHPDRPGVQYTVHHRKPDLIPDTFKVVMSRSSPFLSVHGTGMSPIEAYRQAEQAFAEKADKSPEPRSEPPRNPVPPSPGTTDPTPAINADDAKEVAAARELSKIALTGPKKNDVAAVIERHLGGTSAEGKFDRKDQGDILELAVNLRLAQDAAYFDPRKTTENALTTAKILESAVNELPTQTVRSEEQQRFQQFSTPPHYAYAVNWIANVGPTDTVLEPSAGVGGIAVFAKNAGAKVIANELSPRRLNLMKALGFDRYFQENAEQLNNILPADVKPTVVVMNPPFSQTAGRMGDKMVTTTGATHIEQALKRLRPGGRLVAIVGGGMSMDSPTFQGWWKRMGRQYAVRANVLVGREVYRKYGTTFPTRVLVFDKAEPGGEPVLGEAETIPDLMRMLEGVRDARTGVSEQPPAQPGREGEADRGEVPAGPDEAVRPATDEAGAGRSETGFRPQAPPATRTERAEPPRRDKPAESDAAAVSEPGPSPAPGARTGETEPEPRRGEPAERAEPPARGERAGVSSPATPGLELAAPEEAAHEAGDLKEAVYENYRPRKAIVAGSKPHPTALVESAAMSAVEMPTPKYRPSLPSETITEGKISDAQLEAVIYAGQAHDQFLPDGRRRGFFIGDGTGVGKGREIAAILLDNMTKGRTKHLWVTERPDLIESAKRDMEGVGADPGSLIAFNKIGPKDAIKTPAGVLFVSYGTLRSAAKPEGRQGLDDAVEGKTTTKKGKSRLQQIIDWVGPDFDGVIAFDEAHNMANAVAMKEEGKRGAGEVSQTAVAGLELQSALPKARILYVSATGATEVRNLAYAERLGLWGEGASFPTKQDFISKLTQGGIAAMEYIARDLKALGRYIARSQSFDGVTQEPLVHDLTDDQVKIYDSLSDAWALVYRNIGAALKLVARNDKGKVDGRAKSAVMGQFYGTQQRFWNQVLTAMQMPTLVRAIKQDIKDGHAAVLQIVNTDEAAMERALAGRQEGDALEDLDLTPRQQLMQYVENGFPVAQMEPYENPDTGTTSMRPVLDSQGNTVVNAEAVAMRDALLDQLGSVKVPDGPLDTLIDHFGSDQVAEITGRKRRRERVTQDDGTEKVELVKRASGVNLVEEKAFRDDKKRILIFSQAGGTGSSYHADRTFKNQRLRVHYLVQAGWRADKAVQGLGRTKRTNEKQPPAYKLASTDVPGHRRFISTIARRMESQGAITKGQRNTGGQGMFKLKDNLESQYAKAALQALYRKILDGSIKGMGLDEFQSSTGLRLIDEKGNPLAQLPPINQFLNRMLALKVGAQKSLFAEFDRLMDKAIQQAQEDGTLDVGVETFKADGGITKVSEDVIYTDDDTGAQTKMVKLEVKNLSERITFDEARKKVGAAGYFAKNKTSGRVYAIHGEVTGRTDAETGGILQGRKMTGAGGRTQFMPMTALDPEKFESLPLQEAEEAWDAEYAAIPKYVTEPVHVITGTLLPIYDRISGPTRVWRLQTDAGERMLGRLVPEELVPSTLARFGINRQGSVPETGAAAAEAVLNGYSLNLSNGWKIHKSLVGGDDRIELTGPDYQYANELSKAGVFTERINYKTRWFIPVGEKAAEVIEALTKHRDVIEAVPPPRGSRGGKGMRPGFALLPRWLAARDSGAEAGNHYGLVRKALESDFVQVAGEKIRGTLGTIALNSMPKITAANRQVGEAGVRFASSTIAAGPIAKSMIAEVFGAKYKDPAHQLMVGAVLTEDNLRSIRNDFEAKEQEAREAGEDDKADVYADHAEAVHTLVGEDGHFKTEEDYQKALGDPEALKAVERWKQVVNPWMDEQYKVLQDLEPDAELPPRGHQLGARINLKAIRKADEGVRKAPAPGGGSTNLLNSLKRSSPFAAKARGNAPDYDINPMNILENTVTRQWEQANKRRFYDALVEAGLAKYGKPGQEVELEGRETVSFPIQRRLLVVARGGGAPVKVPQNQAIYVRADLANEVRRSLNVDPDFKNQIASRLAGLITTIQLVGPIDFIVHVTNILTAITTRPGVGGSILGELAVRVAGFPVMFPVAVARTLSKAIAVMRDTPAIRKQIEELATIGALRNVGQERQTFRKRGEFELPDKLQLARKAIEVIDKAGRLVLADMFDFGVRRLGFENTETNRREFINQVGRYNRRTQGLVMSSIIRSGLGPFAVAGTTFNMLGIRGVLGRPGVKSKNLAAGVALWIATLAPLVSTFVVSRTLNMMTVGQAEGRAGLPVGAIDTGMDNSDGRPIYVDPFRFGAIRRGARLTGLNAVAEAYQSGEEPLGQTVDRAFKESANGLLHPFLGPAVQMASLAVQRREIGVDTPMQVPVPPPDEEGVSERVLGALKAINPNLETYFHGREAGKSPVQAIGRSLAGSMGVGAGRTTPQKAIHGARLREFAEDLARRAKRVPVENGVRRRFIWDATKDLAPADKERVRRIVIYDRGALIRR